MKAFFSVLLAAAVSGQPVPHSTNEGAWHDEQGKPRPNTSSHKFINGFGGMLLVTPDKDWQRKWQTPSVVVPHFNEAHSVAKGGQLFILIFFSNPAVASDGQADISCRLEVVRPNGSFSIQQDAVCWQGPLTGPATQVFLAAPSLAFVGDPPDPVGKWLVRVVLKDNIRGVTVPLQTSFVLKDG
jgi:hypothetical protein